MRGARIDKRGDLQQVHVREELDGGRGSETRCQIKGVGVGGE